MELTQTYPSKKAAAEVLRNEIKDAIKDARRVLKDDTPPAGKVVYVENPQGDKDYRGDPLVKLVTRLVKSLEMGLGWGWSLVQFAITQPLINDQKQMHVVPLSDQAFLKSENRPPDHLPEGTITYLENTPQLNSGATVLCIVRY
ncbi:hypothetical protein BJX76DRAFT_362923 [Aspergillus varians]